VVGTNYQDLGRDPPAWAGRIKRAGSTSPRKRIVLAGTPARLATSAILTLSHRPTGRDLVSAQCRRWLGGPRTQPHQCQGQQSDGRDVCI